MAGDFFALDDFEPVLVQHGLAAETGEIFFELAGIRPVVFGRDALHELEIAGDHHRRRGSFCYVLEDFLIGGVIDRSALAIDGVHFDQLLDLQLFEVAEEAAFGMVL